MKNFFELYDILLDGIDTAAPVTGTRMGQCWTAVETAEHFGMAMTTPVDTAPRLLSGDYTGMPLRELAAACRSWNLTEAGYGMAAVNAFYNTPARLAQLNAYEPFERYCTDGLDLRGRHIGVVGHLNMPPSILEQAASVRILERSPRPGDYPDSACDFILPRCDLVLITGSSLINKTLPHLLQLCKNAYTILTGPSVPMCPALLDFGIDRLSGMVVTNREGMRQHVRGDTEGTPYVHGTSFMLKK